MNLATPERLVLPNQRAMLLAALLPRKLERVLDLGTGGAGFVRALGCHGNAPELVCVDDDPHMVTAARRFFQLSRDQIVHLEDATAFMARDRGLYDLILCDLFRGREGEPGLESAEFYHQLAARLKAGGAIAVNTLPRDEEQLRRVLSCARGRFSQVAALSFDDLGNVVVFLSETPLPDPRIWAQYLDQSPWKRDDFLTTCLRRLVVAGGAG